MEKLNRKDARFIAICLVIIVIGASVTLALFRRAFPEASIRFEVLCCSNHQDLYTRSRG